MSAAELSTWPKRTPLLLALAAVAAVATALAAPSSPLLPGPETLGEQALAAAFLLVFFACGFLLPLPALLALVPVLALEGAVRRWVVNDVAVFMLKDFLLLGIYAATIPRLTRVELRRPWWLLAPLLALVALVFLHLPRTTDLQQAVIGLRSYLIYLPLLWVAPKLLSRRHAVGVLWIVLVLAAAQGALGAVQTLTGNEFLNKLTLNTVPALITHEGVSYLRPTGTFLQVGTFAAFFFCAVVCVLAVGAGAPRGKLLWAAVAAAVPITWGVVLGSSRALTWTTVAAVALFVALCVVWRRWLPLGAALAAMAIGYVSLHHLPIGGGSEFNKNIEVTYLDRHGKIVRQHISIATGDAKAVEGFVAKGTRTDTTDFVGGGVPHNRLEEQWRVVSTQGVVGHGTGSMTLGSNYVLPNEQGVLQGEGMYSKLAWELGLPGLAVFCLFLLAVLVATSRAAWRARGEERAVALVAAGAALLLPLWFVLTFALDYPIVASIYYLLGGYVIAQRPAPSA